MSAKESKDAQLVIRVEPSIVERAAKLQAHAEKVGFATSISAVYRKALEVGLTELERRAQKNR